MDKKILFPADYSEASNAALRHAVSLARVMKATLLVVHVKPGNRERTTTAAPSRDDPDEAQAGLVTLLTSFTRPGQKAVEHEFRVLNGDPATEIARVAEEEQVDLIVMATAGRTGLSRLILGSVAEAVVRSVACPVVTVKQPFPVPAPKCEMRDDATGVNETDPLSAVALLKRAISARATDIHMDPCNDDTEVRFRIDGRLEHYCRLSQEIAHPLSTQLKVLAEVDIADPLHPQEGRLTLPEELGSHEVRLTRVRVLGGESIALRLLDRERLLRPLETLGLSALSLARMHRMLCLGEGIVLVTGPTGSGKTTTAYSMAHALDDVQRSVVTIEDPPEYRIASFRQMAVDPRHGVTMTSGLRNLLRMDPDVVLVGEIRDCETAEMAMRAANSGKYVFTTLHTRDVVSTITALRDMHIDNRSLAGNLTGIISQRLVRRLCPHCRQWAPPDKAQLDIFITENIEPPTRLPMPVGCGECRDRGYHERIGVFEVFLPDRATRDAIEHGQAEYDLRDMMRSGGTRSLLADGLTKVCDGITTLDEVCAMTWASIAASPKPFATM